MPVVNTALPPAKSFSPIIVPLRYDNSTLPVASSGKVTVILVVSPMTPSSALTIKVALILAPSLVISPVTLNGA